MGSFVAVNAGAVAVFEELRRLLVAEGLLSEDEAKGLSEATLEDIMVRCTLAGRPPEGVEASELEYYLPGGRALKLGHRVRCGACDVLFEGDNADGEGIAHAVADALLLCPVDTRRALASSVAVVGGLASLPGLEHRCAAEVESLLLADRRYAAMRGSPTHHTRLKVALKPAGVGLEPSDVTSDRNRLVDELVHRLKSSCQVTQVELVATEAEVSCTMETTESPDAADLEGQGAITVGQRSYVIEGVSKETTQLSTGIASTLQFLQLPVPPNTVAWAGGAAFGALEFLSERSLDREAYMGGKPLPDWSRIGDEAVAPEEPKKEAAVPGHRVPPRGRPRAWGHGSLAETHTPKLVP